MRTYSNLNLILRDFRADTTGNFITVTTGNFIIDTIKDFITATTENFIIATTENFIIDTTKNFIIDTIVDFITDTKEMLVNLEKYISIETITDNEKYKKNPLFYLSHLKIFRAISNKNIINLPNSLFSTSFLERSNKQIQKIGNIDDKVLEYINCENSLCYDKSIILNNRVKFLESLHLNNKIFFGRVCKNMKEYTHDEKNNIFRILRIGFDLSADELAKEINISRSYIFAIEKGTKKPSDKIIDSYSNYFGINKDALLDLMEQSRNSTFQKILFKILQLSIK